MYYIIIYPIKQSQWNSIQLMVKSNILMALTSIFHGFSSSIDGALHLWWFCSPRREVSRRPRPRSRGGPPAWTWGSPCWETQDNRESWATRARTGLLSMHGLSMLYPSGLIMIYPPKIWRIMVPHHQNMGKRTGNVWWICWRPKGVPKPAIAWWESRGNLLFLPTNTRTVVFWRTQEDLLTGVVSYGNGSKLYTTLHNKCFRSIWYQEWPISVRGDPAFEPTFCMLNYEVHPTEVRMDGTLMALYRYFQEISQKLNDVQGLAYLGVSG